MEETLGFIFSSRAGKTASTSRFPSQLVRVPLHFFLAICYLSTGSGFSEAFGSPRVPFYLVGDIVAY